MTRPADETDLLALLEKATPGPWRWEVNARGRQMSLCGGKPQFDLTIMDFKRWGLASAKARLLVSHEDVGHLMRDADQFAAVVPGREHHASWFQTIDHPDANLIAAAPTAIRTLLTRLQGYREDADLTRRLGMTEGINAERSRILGLFECGLTIDRLRTAVTDGESAEEFGTATQEKT